MDVTTWKTPAPYFPWSHVQQYIDIIDSAVYCVAIEFAQERFLAHSQPCSRCGAPAAELFWLCVTDSEPTWDAGNGRVGFLTVCERCQLQVEFLVDPELTEMQAEQWRTYRTLS